MNERPKDRRVGHEVSTTRLIVEIAASFVVAIISVALAFWLT